MREDLSAKVVIWGPAKAGKTTVLKFIASRVRSDHRGELSSYPAGSDTTVLYDQLTIQLGDVKGIRTEFQLYTVPGNPSFLATQKRLLLDVAGVIFVADSDRNRVAENSDSIRDLLAILREYGKDITLFPFVFLYNKQDLPTALSIDRLNHDLNRFGAPSLETVATEGRNILQGLTLVSRAVIKTHQRLLATRAKVTGPQKIAPPSPTERPVEMNQLAVSPIPPAHRDDPFGFPREESTQVKQVAPTTPIDEEVTRIGMSPSLQRQNPTSPGAATSNPTHDLQLTQCGTPTIVGPTSIAVPVTFLSKQSNAVFNTTITITIDPLKPDRSQLNP